MLDESFIQLKFYPPVPTDEYVDQVPYKIQAKIFESSNLQAHGYKVRDGFKLLIRSYCTTDLYTESLIDEFWKVLKEELIKHYSEKDCGYSQSL